jgi:hypothetical protein
MLLLGFEEPSNERQVSCMRMISPTGGFSLSLFQFFFIIFSLTKENERWTHKGIDDEVEGTDRKQVVDFHSPSG